MKIRYIVRPSAIHLTPKALAQGLEAKTRKWPSDRFIPDWKKDFLLTYPERVANAPDSYSTIRRFAAASKPGQRAILSSEGLPVPAWDTRRDSARTLGERTRERIPERARTGREAAVDTLFIVRPLRHSGGENYRITRDCQDFTEGQEYISGVFPKKHEYRIIYCKGTPIVTLVKRIPEGTRLEDPWNHTQGATFVTVEHEENNRLRHTDIYEKLAASPIIKDAHLIGVDILYRARTAVIAEFNFCPALTIENNLRKVTNHVQSIR